MTQVLSFANGTMKFGDGTKMGQRLTTEEALEIVGVAQAADEVPVDPPVDDNQGEVKLTLPEDFDDLKVDDLKKFAADNGIDLGTATLKDDIKAAIVAAVNPAPVDPAE